MKINLGVVGCGIMGQNVHIPSFMKCANCEVVALAETQHKLARAVADRWKISKVYDSSSDLVEDKDVDAVAIITNKHTHAPIALEALETRKHVFIEKPIATTYKDALKMADAADKNDVKLMVGYMKRYDTGIQLAKTIFDQLQLEDKVTCVRSHLFGGDWICGPFPLDMIKTDEKGPNIKQVWPDFLPSELYPIMDWLLEQIHDINLPRFFFGEPISVRTFENWRDSFISLWNYKDYPLVLEMGKISADFWDEQLMIYFLNHWIDIRPPPPLLRNMPTKVHVYYGGKIQKDEVPHGKWEWSFEREAQHFIDCIIRDKEPVSNGRDSSKDILILETMLKSKMANNEVKFNL